jgi:predicted metal-binding membrane protein
MERAAHRFDAWVLLLGAASLAGWSALALYRNDVTLSAFCAGGSPGAPPLSVALSLALVVNAPFKLVTGWALMIVAMMAPLVVAPLRHVHDRSFARRRARAILLFVAGYVAVWMVAGVALQVLALAARWAAPAPLVCFSLACAVALVWQVSPAKQWCLNRCHRQPQLAAFGMAADHDALVFGLSNGVFCVGACWALMLLPLLVGRGHLPAMIAVALFVFAERFEATAPLHWRWRGFATALRIVTARARLHLAACSGATADP